ncbi:hypothetical protein OG874_02130 [Nocardia sp. NBC_00565]|uniref:hypothetical protein n=1 Tax=Nocardia sp. NBC_00565 TaxID=2975993 RepID=UPI002E80E857|nr:hypothetical protein [Nocardia sp. NBC_00565]WUC04036.1 hypothetical protein OG874_02130 [Nocardia sp. NBC_00565]
MAGRFPRAGNGLADTECGQELARGTLGSGQVEVFPGAIEWDTARYRTGLRPMTPDGPPLIGLGS